MGREWALGRFRRLVLESRKQPRVGEHALQRVQRRPIWWRWSRWWRFSSLALLLPKQEYFGGTSYVGPTTKPKNSRRTSRNVCCIAGTDHIVGSMQQARKHGA